jgi:O-succinylbenzoic acid--CoA ligase
MIVADVLRERARSTPDRIALVCGGEAVSYRELDARADRVARRLAGLGVGPGDRVAVLAPNGIPFAVLVHALARLRAVLVPLPTRLVSAELVLYLQDADPVVLLADPRFREAVLVPGWTNVVWITPDHPDLLPEIPPFPIAFADRVDLDAVQGVVYTSGSTGHPKGVLLTYGNHWWNAWGWALRTGVREDDTWLVVLPFFHVGGLAILWRAVLFGATVVVHEAFEPDAVWDVLRRGGVTLVSLVSTMLRRVLDHGGDRPFAPSVRAVLLGGGPVPPDLVERCLRARIPLSPTYGLTEAASQVATLRPEELPHHPRSCGRPLVPVEVRIAEDGEILVRGPTVMQGYWRRSAETQDALRDGWLHTGDFGFLDPDGYLHVLDRREDRITTGGENVAPEEVEAVLRLNPAVEDVGVVGVPDPEWGQIVVAVVRLRPDGSATEEELRAFCRRSLAPFKVPKRILFCEALPRTGPEKLDRRALRTWAEQVLTR